MHEVKSPVDGLSESLERLARGTPDDLIALLHDFQLNHLVAGTKVTAHCHSLRLDGNNRPRVMDLVRTIADNVLDFAIPRSKLSEAFSERDRTGSSHKITRLHTEAKRLFTQLSNSGEGGELLLFVLGERILRLPQIICKMDLKTSSEMHVHGVDGVHLGVDPTNGRLALYWGESKIYKDASDAIRECLKDLAPVLIDQSNGGNASDRDMQLLQRHADLENPELEAGLKSFLDPSHPNFNLLEFRGLCLVGYDCDSYSQGTFAEMVTAVQQRLPDLHTQIANRVGKEKLTDFTFHFICVPFPSAEDFRTRLVAELS